MLTLFCTVAGVHLLASMMPGPDFLYVSTASVSKSRNAALASVLGITAGVAIWGFIALTGLSVLLNSMAWLQQGIQIFGGLYLCWIGFQMLIDSGKQTGTATTFAKSETISIQRVFLRGLLTNLSNPKVFVYFGSIFSLFVGDDIPPQARWVLLVMMMAVSFLWFSLVATFFSLPRVKQGYQKCASKINKIAGVLFTGLGLHLILVRN
ncbi:LysE family transporter [Serratia marcescens]|nr:LysE family transporter [Serratia marcescens]